MDEDKEEKHEEVEVIEKGHSRFIGVSWNKPSNKWKAQSKVQGKQVHIWHYDIEEDTARAYQDYVEHGTLPARVVPTSAFRVVSWRKSIKAWEAKIFKNGQCTHLESFKTQQEAALAYNAAATRLGCPASWLNDVGHARSADRDDHNNKDAPAGKKAVVAACAKPTCRRRLTGTRAGRSSKTPPPAAVGGTATQHLTPYGVQREANIVCNSERMVALGVAGLARKAGLPPEHCLTQSPAQAASRARCGQELHLEVGGR